jgi:cytochrome c biogenesis protein CcmG, thiol:disulfide interchange protein DsbE
MSVSAGKLLTAGVGIAVAGLLAYGLLTPAPEGTGIGPGSRAPDFSAVTLDAPVVTRTLADYAGSVVLLNIWATYCPPCLEEMPTMQQLHEAYADRGLRVVAVSIDDAGAGDLIREFRTEQHLTFEILHDPEFNIFDDYALSGVPMTFLIDRRGTIRLARFAADWFTPENRAEVEKLLPSS